MVNSIVPSIKRNQPEIVYAAWYRNTPVGDLYLTSDEDSITGLWFADHEKYYFVQDTDTESPSLPILQSAMAWLDAYFQGRDPGALLPVNLYRTTPFRQMVCEEMCRIPFGQTDTYGAIARRIAARVGKDVMSSRAVGGGVGHNPISIMIPCHRVVGSSNSLTGYGGGIDRKIALLELEGVDLSRFTVPSKGTAL